MSFKETEVGRIPIDWEVDELSNKVDLVMGQSPKSEFYNDKGIGMPFMQGRTTFGEKYHYINTWCTDIKRVGIKNSVLMSVRAPVGDVNIAIEDICIGRGLASLNMKNKNNEFLYYLLKNYSGLLISKESGTVFGSINKAGIEKLVLPFPSKSEQKAIAKILSDLDEKIEVNNKINKNLEEMAQAIFKQWFVDFEFPNEEGKPYKSSGGEMVKSELGMIPKGWKVFYMEEFLNTYNGYSYKGKELTKSNDAMITIKNFDRKGGYKLDGLKEISISNKVKEHHYIDINDIVIAHTDLTQGAEIIGNPIMVYSKGKYNKLIMSMDTVKVTSKKSNINNSLLYYIFKDFRFKSFALKFVNGTTVLHLSKTTIPKYKIALPNDENILLKIGGILNSLTNKISNNIIENERLEKLRDTLLPKLMSGEIRVCLENSEN